MIEIKLEPGRSKFPHLLTSGNIGRMLLRNRIIMAPMVTRFASEGGAITQRLIDYYVERAKGGVGAIITGSCAPETRLGGRRHGLVLDNNLYISRHSELVDAVHFHGAKIMLQLNLAGRHSNPNDSNGKRPIAPSAVPELIPGLHPIDGTCPRELTIEEIHELQQQFVVAAQRAKRAGYDALEIHGAHGYLIHQFMSDRSNRRNDYYGGNLENRIRFAVEIIEGIKSRLGKDFPIIFRLTAEETVDRNGYSLEDAKFFAKSLENASADAIHVTMGTFEDTDGISRTVCPASFPQGWRVTYAEALKGVLNIPVIVVGAIREPEYADEVLRSGKADFIAMGRELLAEPEWVRKVAADRLSDIRLCPSCNFCAHRLGLELSIRCAINPALGREREFSKMTPAGVSKRVMIVGSGPAGLQAAVVAAFRGHRVDLYEKGRELGEGQLNLISVAPGKQKLAWFKKYLVGQIEKNSVKLHLNTEVNEAIVDREIPDVLIIATGARPLIPNILGVDKKIVVTAHDLLRGNVEITGNKVAVIGGYSTGCEAALYLVERNNQVIIVSRSSKGNLARGAFASNRYELISKLLHSTEVTILFEHETKEIGDSEIVVIDKNWNERKIQVGMVVLARGVISINELANKVVGRVPEIYVIGDAAEPRNITSAIMEGADIARMI